jgi:MinD-like ATPase involved in chromosome partitioning or flagellar assembly
MAVNRGKPVALAEPGADFSKAIKNLAEMVAARSTGPKAAGQKQKKDKQPRRSILSKLRS